MTEIKNADGNAIRINLNCVMKIFKRYRTVRIKPGEKDIAGKTIIKFAHNLGSSRIYGSTVCLVTQYLLHVMWY